MLPERIRIRGQRLLKKAVGRMKMRLKFSAPLAFALILGLVALLPGTAFAQDPNLDTTSRPPVVPAAPATNGISAPTPNGSGTAFSGTWIAASKFTARLNSAAPMLSYQTYHYYNSVGSAGPTGYFAQVDLEPGVQISSYTCIFNDASVTNDVYTALQKYSTDFTTTPPTRSGTFLGSGTSTGNAGVQFQNVALSVAETFRPLPDGYHLNTYYLRADVASDTSLDGCLVFWSRQVSPSPGVATFSDVPLSDYRNKFVEALYSAGITAGCGGSPPNFCPDAPLTRGAMAVFLAAGLGLNWPY
jgi:hypothetical protein